ncbi:hypothetical protein COW46_00785 [Candidatus Gracilibacteria bacterium CG17_big_fil_post_rev_8_21_14_2_50_48_13]|nr:MAG: hypothetical protein COW46_00785 [Candidatus Gracilibacteria bacterium CG17_big_fil_post_rev_8_21_14_2_50_48_13]
MTHILFNKFVLGAVGVASAIALVAGGAAWNNVFDPAAAKYREYAAQVIELEIEVKRLQATWAEKQKIITEAQQKQAEVNALANERKTKIQELRAKSDALGKE